jgi:hypothetical protein
MNIRRFVITLAILFLSASVGSALAATRYEQIQQRMRSIVLNDPTHAELFTLGVSDSGKPIEGVKIGSGPINQLIVATHHGNEYGSTEVAVAVAEDLAKKPISNQTVFVIPVLNIQGYNNNQREELDAKGISRDPNRDYPSPCKTGANYYLKSTHLLADFVQKQNIVSSATMHTFFPAVTFPWGVTTKEVSTPYDGFFQLLADKATSVSNYKTGFTTEVVYPVDGAFEDFAYWVHGTWSLLFEMGRSHSPNAAAVQKLLEQNVPGVRAMLEMSKAEPAPDHSFTGKCDYGSRSLDRHDE